jgi:hypothetical protein
MTHSMGVSWLARGCTVGCAALLTWLSTGSAAAQPEPTNAKRTAAEALFTEARRLMDEGDYEKACPKFADSQRLDPAVGTLLNLGLCYKQSGKTASAWSAYREAAALARAAAQTDREELAETEANALEAKLSKLVISVPETAQLEKLEVELDGAPVLRGLWDVAAPVDPGEHTVAASAPNKEPWTGRITVAPEATETLTVPVLEDATLPAPAQAQPLPTAPTPAATAPSVEPVEVATDEETDGLGTQRVIAIALGGVGLAGAAVGTVYGLGARNDLADSDSQCSLRNVCTDDGIQLREDARDKAALATVGFGVGLAGVAGCVLLWLTATDTSEQPPGSAPTLQGSLTPAVGDSPWAVTVRGAW